MFAAPDDHDVYAATIAPIRHKRQNTNIVKNRKLIGDVTREWFRKFTTPK